MYTTGEWEVRTTGTHDVLVVAGTRFVAWFGSDEDDPQEHEEVVGNAVRTVACVRACDGLQNPEHEVRQFRRESEILRRYREAFAQLNERLVQTTTRLQVLREEARASRVAFKDEDLLRALGFVTDCTPPDPSAIPLRALYDARVAVGELTEAGLEAEGLGTLKQAFGLD